MCHSVDLSHCQCIITKVDIFSITSFFLLISASNAENMTSNIDEEVSGARRLHNLLR